VGGGKLCPYYNHSRRCKAREGGRRKELEDVIKRENWVQKKKNREKGGSEGIGGRLLTAWVSQGVTPWGEGKSRAVKKKKEGVLPEKNRTKGTQKKWYGRGEVTEPTSFRTKFGKKAGRKHVRRDGGIERKELQPMAKRKGNNP